jgi:hypothetical protein
MLWTKVVSNELPMRFQIPRGYCEYGKSPQFNLVHLEFLDNQEFLTWFKDLELKLLDGKEPIDSRVKENTIHVKYVEGFTQIFDESDTFLFDYDKNFVNCDLDCLVEIDKVYGPMKDTGSYGITCKIFQVRVVPREERCLFE